MAKRALVLSSASWPVEWPIKENSTAEVGFTKVEGKTEGRKRAPCAGSKRININQRMSGAFDIYNPHHFVIIRLGAIPKAMMLGS